MRGYPLVFMALISILTLGGCSASPSAAPRATEDVSTLPPPSATPIPPTETPLPTWTDTPEPTPSPTPRFARVQDDFSSRSEIWGECENCSWNDGQLLFGPFPPSGSGQDQIFYVFCEACGEHMYYRVAGDVTYVEGYGGDRTFGILAGLGIHDILAAGTVTTAQHAMYETFDLTTKRWGDSPFRVYGAVAPGSGTNRIEVTIVPSRAGRGADITMNVNGKDLIILYDEKVMPSKVGLYLGWHSIGVAYDNFEYEEIETPEEEIAALSLTPCDISKGDLFLVNHLVGVSGTITRANDAGSIWTATLDGRGCQLPIKLDIEKYRVWVEEKPEAFENGVDVYLIGDLGAIMKPGFDPEDISTIDAYLALEVEVMPELIE